MKQQHCFFRGAPKISEKIDFCRCSLYCLCPIKQKNLNQDAIHFKSATYRELHQRSNKTTSFAEHLKFQEQMTLTYALSVKSRKLK